MLETLDYNCLMALQNLREAWGNVPTNYMFTMTEYGELKILWPMVVAVYWCISKSNGMWLLYSMGLGRIIGQFLKPLCCINRPWVLFPDVHPTPAALATATGFSFPSGHAICTATTWGVFALMLRKSRSLFWLLMSFVLLNGLSRVYLGVHTVSDVIVGWVCGFMAVGAVAWVLRFTESRPRFRWILPVGGVLASAALFAFAATRHIQPVLGKNGTMLVDPVRIMADSYKACSMLLAVALGCAFERRFIRFDEKAGTWQEKLLRFLLGYCILLLLTTVLKPLFVAFMDFRMATFWARLFEILFITVGYPWMIVRLEKRRKLSE